MGRKHNVWLTMLLAAWLQPGCGELLGLRDGVAQGECESAAQCAPGFACWRGQCRNACASDEECDEDARCIRSANGAACEPLGDSLCDTQLLRCPQGTRCEVAERACFTECDDDSGCAAGQHCELGLCRSDDPQRNPKLRQPADSGDGGGVQTDAGAGSAQLLGEPCGSRFELACRGPADKVKLICDGTWQLNGSCDDGELCNQATGGCAPIVEQCVNREPGEAFCEGEVLRRCGPDLVTVEGETCDDRCVDTGAGAQCAAAGCGDQRVVAPEQCDDGNADNQDACTSLCQEARCGDGFVFRDAEECAEGDQD